MCCILMGLCHSKQYSAVAMEPDIIKDVAWSAAFTGPSVVLCMLYLQLIVHLLIDPLLACWFYLLNFVCVVWYLYMTINLYFNGFPCYTVSYYNYKSVWPYIVVIHIHNSLPHSDADNSKIWHHNSLNMHCCCHGAAWQHALLLLWSYLVNQTILGLDMIIIWANIDIAMELFGEITWHHNTVKPVTRDHPSGPQKVILYERVFIKGTNV